MAKLEGKVAIVVGGGRGLGREIAMLYAEESADVTVAARTLTEIEAVAQGIRALGKRALAVSTDITVEDQVNHLVQRTIEEFGKIDILVNAAGGPMGSAPRMPWDLTLEKWHAVLDCNVTGVFLCCRAVAPQMMKQKSGSIINISSNRAKRGIAGYGAYSAAKFAIEGLSQALAAELAPFNVRVNCMRPGRPTVTPGLMGPAEQRELVRGSVIVRPDIVRPLALFLASDDSSGMTNQSLNCIPWNLEHGFGDVSQYQYVPPEDSDSNK